MKNIVKKFLKSESGSFAHILGVSIIPTLMTAGVAADYAGFKRMETRMHLSAEAAMLAVSKKVMAVREADYADNGVYNLTNAQIVEKMDEVFKPFFEANFAAGGYDLTGDQYTLEYIEADNNTKVRVTMNYDTAVMKAFGTDYMTAEREMIINLKVQPKNYVIDVVMCIDATGSMQNTLNAVQANAMTFNQDLREELGVGIASNKIKIRVRPIFYRDWEEGRDYNNAMVAYNAAYQEYLDDHAAWEAASTGGSGAYWADVLDELTEDWNDSSWYYKNGSRWRKSTRSWHPKTHKRIEYENKYYYFETSADLEDWVENLAASSSGGVGGGAGAEPTPPVKPVNHGLNMYSDFIDLDPNESTGATKADRNTELTSFLGSTYAFGGNDWPEAAGACLNEAIRSNWFDNQSAEAREYFNIPSHHVIIKENETPPAQTYTRVTPIPVVVFWSDATINSLQLSRDYLSPTTPTTYTGLQNLWNGILPAGDPLPPTMPSSGSPVIDQAYKVMIRFGPASASGFNTIAAWDRVYYGGSLATGNDDAVKVIAEKVLEAIPDLLRVGS